MNGEFISTAGTYFVMSKLAINEIHASCTFGNAPIVDILACSADGSKSISIQVKTAENAKRTRGRGKEKKLDHVEFNLGHKAAKYNSENLFFAFVDLDQDWSEVPTPTVYIIPSNFIFEYHKDWSDAVSWLRFHPKVEEIEKYKDNWDILKTALKN